MPTTPTTGPAHAHSAKRAPTARLRALLPGLLPGLALGLLSSALLRAGYEQSGQEREWIMFLASLVGAALPLVAGGFASQARRPWLAALAFGLGTVPGWTLTHLYQWAVAGPSMLGLALYLGAWSSLLVGLWAFMLRRGVPGIVYPVLLVALEFLRTDVVLGGYPWFVTGHGAIGTPIKWAATWGGVPAVSLILALLAVGLLAQLTGRLTRTLGAAIALMVSLAMLIGWLGTPRAPGERALITAAIQTNLPQDNKVSWPMHARAQRLLEWLELTRQAARATPKPDVIIWPETMFPGPALNAGALDTFAQAGLYYTMAQPVAPDVLGGSTRVDATWFAQQLLDTQRAIGVPMLVGTEAVDGLKLQPGLGGTIDQTHTGRYNSLLLIDAGRPTTERYDKIDLTPFGEYIPLAWRWPSVQSALLGLGAQGLKFDLNFGARTAPLQVAGARIAPPICFEISYARACRRLAYAPAAGGGLGGLLHTRSADLLVSVSNDGWFGPHDFSRRAHVLMGRWRCLELGLPMVRAVNTGWSCAIDPAGNITARTLDGTTTDALHAQGIQTARVPLPAASSAGTLYGRTGDWLGPLCTLLSTVVLVWAWRNRV
jgi:apolipoprotein N-acyltransferase